MLFGSELFESIIGELQSATTVKVRQRKERKGEIRRRGDG
jgi:hypothetical protein